MLKCQVALETAAYAKKRKANNINKQINDMFATISTRKTS